MKKNHGKFKDAEENKKKLREIAELVDAYETLLPPAFYNIINSILRKNT